MDKIITVSGNYAKKHADSEPSFKVHEHPDLDKILKEGYKVQEIIPIIKPNDPTGFFAFVIRMIK